MTAQTPTVLLVEDERDLADTYAAWLSGRYDVRTAYDGERALELLDGVDVVLLDRRLPGMTGDEVLDAIRDHEAGHQVAMVTAVEPDVDVLELGFDDYLVKPVSREDLQDVIERLARRVAYDEAVQRHFALVSKLAALETYRSEDELQASEEYARLQEELADLTERLSAHQQELTETDYAALFRRTTG